MAHEITAQDSLVLSKKSAWHGLGTVVQEDMNPHEALELADLDWKLAFPESIEATMPDGTVLPVEKTRPLYRVPRTEKGETDFIELGHFGQGFVPIQNEEIAELAYSFGDGVKVESAGSLSQGKRVWFLLKGETLEFGADVIQPYMTLLNGNDSTLSLSVFPTSVRIVCNNTLTMALNENKGRMFRIPHAGNYQARMTECAQALKQYKTIEAKFHADIADMKSRQVKSEKDVVDFWKNAYHTLYGVPDTNRKQQDAIGTIGEWDAILQQEMLTLGQDTPDAWLLGNAVTNQIQHKEPGRETDGWEARRMYSNLAGENATKSLRIMNTASASF